MILVSGGTGFVGSAVTRELLKRGEQVAVLGRDAGKIERLFGGEAEARVGDVRKPEELASAMSGADVVINAVQIPTSPIEVPRRGWTFEEVDYKGTVNQVDAAKAAGVKRFLYVSGVGVAPGSPQHWFRLKWQAEQYLINSGLEWTVVRPTWVFGPDDWALNRLLNFTNFLPFLPFFGDGKQAMQPVFVEDLGRVIADAALAPAAANQLFEAGGPDVMTMNDVLKTALDVKGRKRFILHQPVFVGKIAGTLASLQPFVTPPLTADAVDFVCSPATADTANLERVLQPQMTPLRAALETYLKK
ncbi:MAG TPA: NAD(P)H-binding protein [Dehalococcoidia bacterium]|jgi:NADH dehydrogenase|nr:NAD(P)H-binding protein [Dehalococcoidia bacterium]